MPVNRRPKRQPVSERLTDRLAEGTVFGRRISDIAGRLRRRAVPNHWSFMFGVVSLGCLLVLVVTGLGLMFLYTPSSAMVEYTGSYLPLVGVDVSQAYASTVHLSLEVRGGLLLRQAHHWAAILLCSSVVGQMLTAFFTGAFRKPRRGQWVLLFVIFVAALLGGWSGYALPDDMLSGTGLRIAEGIALGIPFIGRWISRLLFGGGGFPGEAIEHLYPIHVVLVPALLIVAISIRSYAAWLQKPAQFSGPGRSQGNVVGIPALPAAATRAGGLLMVVAGVLLLFSATVQIAPIWKYGPADPGSAAAGSQPDWYTGFLDGALRLVPPGWEFQWLDRTWTLAVVVPLGVVTAFLLAVAAYPFVEQWITGDRRDHHLLDRPRNVAMRTAVGVAGLVFYGTLWVAGSADIIATQLQLSFEGVIGFLQVMVVVGPLSALVITRQLCVGLQLRDRDILRNGFETGTIVRLPSGAFAEPHQPVDEYTRWRLSDLEPRTPVPLRPDDRGVLAPTRRLRARLARLFDDDQVAPADDRVQALSSVTAPGLPAVVVRDVMPSGAGGTRTGAGAGTGTSDG